MSGEIIYQDDAGRLRLLGGAGKLGDRYVSSRGVVLAERVIPAPGHAPPGLFNPERRAPSRRLAYLYLRGIIFWAEESGSPSSGRVTYRKMWPVLKGNFQGDLSGIVGRIISNRLDVEADIPVIGSYMIRADNFFVFRDRAWWADRFNLYSGVLVDGKNFRGTATRVQGVPRDQDPNGDYNHISRVFVVPSSPPFDKGGQGGFYRMYTEERVMRSSGLRRAYENNRAIINEYVSSDLVDWSFSRTVAEDLSIDPRDHQKKTPIPGLPVNYKPRVFEHRVIASGARQSQTTDLSSHLGSLYPQPAEIYIERSSGGYRAYLNRYGINTTWTSAGGLEWAQESTLNEAYSRQGSKVGNTAVVSVGRR